MNRLHACFHALIAMWMFSVACTANALVIHFDFSALDDRTDLDEQTKADVRAGYIAGGHRWEQAFADPVTVNIRADYGRLDDTPEIARSTSSVNRVSYAAVRASLVGDARTTADASAVAHLPSVAFGFRYRENPLGSTFDPQLNHYDLAASELLGSVGPNDGSNQAREDNDYLSVSTANMKALGLVPKYRLAFDAVPVTEGAPADGAIAVASNYAFDFDASDGIAGGRFDFAGVVAHEIGHVLGFNSGADVLDSLTGLGACRDFGCGFVGPGAGRSNYFKGIGDEWGWNGTVLDLFRYSALSFSDVDGKFLGFDLTSGLADPRPLTLDQLFSQPLSYWAGALPYFSIDGGATPLGLFGTGQYNGITLRADACRDPVSGDEFAIEPNTACPDGTDAFQFDLPPDLASHWLDTAFTNAALGVPYGLMDGAREGPGVRERFSALDYTAFDAIGWDLAVPGPAGAPVVALVFLVPWLSRRRGR